MATKNREIVAIGSYLEGAKCEIYTRKAVFKHLQKDPITATTMIKYELCRNCSVEITEEHSISDEKELNKRMELNVFRSVGDKLKADSISLWIDQRIPLRIDVREGATATHGGQFLSTKKRTVAKIKYPFENLPEKLAAPRTIKMIK